MTDHRTVHRPDQAARLQRRRRAKRGVVAGYVHELSQRHRNSEQPRPQPVTVPAARDAERVVA
jgi:hypothetical protein